MRVRTRTCIAPRLLRLRLYLTAVLFLWAMLTAEVEKDDAKAVFKMIVNLWITIRGFGFASSWLELYKQEKT